MDDDQNEMYDEEEEEEKVEFNIKNQRLNERSPSPELNFKPPTDQNHQNRN